MFGGLIKIVESSSRGKISRLATVSHW